MVKIRLNFVVLHIGALGAHEASLNLFFTHAHTSAVFFKSFIRKITRCASVSDGYVTVSTKDGHSKKIFCYYYYYYNFYYCYYYYSF